MAYIEHSDEWWEEETQWVEKEFEKTKRIAAFTGYVETTLKHCCFNGPPECAERIKAVYTRLIKGDRS